MPWQITGHEWAVTLLERSLATGRLAHAYLFTGPPQIGKTTLARALAQALNCQQADAPCGRCASCRKTAQQTHPDVRLIGPTRTGEGSKKTGSESLKIDQIRALQREAILAPYEGRYRVFILRRMELATLEAANSLLKTLEEPSSQVVLILTAVRPEALPPTVVSRCQRLDLRPVALDLIEEMLCRQGLPPDEARLIARLSGGRPGWALEACRKDSDSLKERQQSLDQLTALLAADRVTRFQFAWKASRDPIAARQQLELWTAWWRDLLLVCGQTERYVVNIDRAGELRRLAAQTSLPEVWALLTEFQVTAGQLEANVSAQLALEGLLLKLPRWQFEAADQLPD